MRKTLCCILVCSKSEFLNYHLWLKPCGTWNIGIFESRWICDSNIDLKFYLSTPVSDWPSFHAEDHCCVATSHCPNSFLMKSPQCPSLETTNKVKQCNDEHAHVFVFNIVCHQFSLLGSNCKWWVTSWGISRKDIQLKWPKLSFLAISNDCSLPGPVARCNHHLLFSPNDSQSEGLFSLFPVYGIQWSGITLGPPA